MSRSSFLYWVTVVSSLAVVTAVIWLSPDGVRYVREVFNMVKEVVLRILWAGGFLLLARVSYALWSSLTRAKDTTDLRKNMAFAVVSFVFATLMSQLGPAYSYFLGLHATGIPGNLEYGVSFMAVVFFWIGVALKSIMDDPCYGDSSV